jgi:hypothetical protein
MTVWNYMYTQFSRNMQTMNEIYNKYINNVKKFNELFCETRQNVNRMNVVYVDSIKANQDTCNLYKENFDNIVRLNQQWSEIFSGPFLGKVSQVKKKVQGEKE